MDLDKLGKVEAPAAKQLAGGLTGRVLAIIRLKHAGYRPAGIQVRSEISGELITAEFNAETLAALELDPEIQSIAISRPVQAVGG
jgi:hypothetical protein